MAKRCPNSDSRASPCFGHIRWSLATNWLLTTYVLAYFWPLVAAAHLDTDVFAVCGRPIDVRDRGSWSATSDVERCAVQRRTRVRLRRVGGRGPRRPLCRALRLQGRPASSGETRRARHMGRVGGGAAAHPMARRARASAHVGMAQRLAAREKVYVRSLSEVFSKSDVAGTKISTC